MRTRVLLFAVVFFCLFFNVAFSQDIGCGFSTSCNISNYNLCPPQFDYYGDVSHSSGQSITDCDYMSRHLELETGRKVRIPVNIFIAQNSEGSLPNPIATSINEVNSIFNSQNVPFEVFLNLQSDILVEKGDFTQVGGSVANQTYYSDFFDSPQVDGVSCNGNQVTDCPSINSEFYKNFFKTDYPGQLNFLLVDKLFHYTDNETFVSCGSCNALGLNSSNCAGSGCFSFEPGGEASFPTDFQDKGAIGIYRFQQFEGETWAHELGHFFGLSHTFASSINANFPNDQDLVADTNFDSSCCSDSPTNNIMDYSNTANNFTTCQIAKMTDVLYSCRSNLSWDLSSPRISIDNGVTSSNALTNHSIVLECGATPDLSFDAVPNNNSVFNTGAIKWILLDMSNGSGIPLQEFDYSESIELSDISPFMDFSTGGSYKLSGYEQIPWNGIDSPLSSVDITIVGSLCQNDCDLQNCFSYATVCNNGIYNVEVFIPPTIPSGFEVQVDTDIQTATPGGTLFFDNGGMGYDLNGTISGQLYNAADPTCQDGATIQPFPTFVSQISDDCGDGRYYIELTGSGANMSLFTVSDGTEIKNFTGGTLVFGPHDENQTISFIIRMAGDNACVDNFDVVLPDCGNPPTPCDITMADITFSNLVCDSEEISILINGDPTVDYTVEEMFNNFPNTPNNFPAQFVPGQLSSVIRFNEDGADDLTYDITNPNIAGCTVRVMADKSECQTNTGGGTGSGSGNLSECGDNNGVYSIYWPFPESSCYSNSSCGADGPCGTMNYSVGCGEGCGFHTGNDQFSQDWGQSGNICNDEFYSPFAGEIIYDSDDCAPSCAASPSCNPTAEPFGNQVIIQSTDGNFAFRVAHLNTVAVSDGDFVSAGQLLGTLGNTGNSFGAHAHVTLYQNITGGFGSTTYANILQDGQPHGLTTNTYGADFEFDCQNSIEVNSFVTANQCVSPGQMVGISFTELGTTQNAIIELCDASGNNCVPIPGAVPFVINKNVNQDTWTFNWTVPNTPGMYTIKVYDQLKPTSSDLSDFSFEISADCNGTVSCVPPPSVTATDNNDGTATLAWTPVTNATGYLVQVKLSSSTEWTTAGSNLMLTEFTSSAPPCVGYDFRVAANCTDGSTTDFNEISFVTNGCSGPSGTGGGGTGTGAGVVGDCPGDNDDDDDPVFLSCPTEPYVFDITQSNNCTASLNWSIPVAVDNCNVSVEHAAGPNVGDERPEGTYSVTYIAEDNNDNTETCTFTVIVEDGEGLTFINCPITPYVYGSDPSQCSVTANWSIPVAVDNCEVTITQIFGPQIGNELAPGDYLVIYQATNNATPQETATCQFQVTVNETENPQLNCPQDVTVENDLAVCEATVNNIQLEFAFDNCPFEVTWTSAPADVTGTGTSTTDNASGAIFPVGITTVTYTITESDDFGNGTEVATCDVIILVEDTELPIITCPADSTIGTSMGGIDDCIAEYTWTHPTPTDNCGVTVYTLTYTNPDGTVEVPLDVLGMEGAAVTRNFELGTTVILYHVEDEAGNIIECTWSVTVEDDEDPMIFCEEVFATNTFSFPEIIDVLPSDITTAQINVVTSATITDLNIPLLAGTHASLSDLSVTLTSPAGTTATLFDGLCAGGTDYSFSLDEAAAANITTAPCSPLGNGGQFQSQSTLDVFNGENSLGLWTLTFDNSFAEGCGTLTDWQLQIIGNDVSPAGTRLQVTAAAGACDYTMTSTDFNPRFTDNCEDPFITHNYIFGPFDNSLQGSVFPVGETTVTWTVTDQAGNTEMCDLIIEVLDNQKPTFTNCPRPDIIQDAEAGICGAFVNFSPPLAEDNCNTATVTQTDATGLSTGSVFPAGMTILEYQASDAAGNTVDCTIRVIVNDTQEPVFACPQSVVQANDAWLCEAVVNEIAPLTSGDNCDDNISVVYQIEYPTGSGTIVSSGVEDASGEVFEKGTSTVTYRQQDQPTLLITEVTQGIETLNGGMNPSPYTVITGDDYLEITNFGAASYNVSGLDIERLGSTGTETLILPNMTIIPPGETLVVHFGNGTDDATNLFFNIKCAANLSTAAPTAYAISFKGRPLDVVALNGYNPVGQGTLAVITPADWSGDIDASGGFGGVYRPFTFDNSTAADWKIADVCDPITIGALNPTLTAYADNGTTTALQSIAPNVNTCNFNVTINDEELPYCGEFILNDYTGASNLNVADGITGGTVFQSVINVPDSYLIGDVDVLNLLGIYADMNDLIFKLTSPEGTKLELISGICATTADFDISLDSEDDFPSISTASCGPLGGGQTFNPLNSLCAVGTAFYGENAQGDWILEIADTTALNNGTLQNWELRISEIQNYSQGDEILDNDAGLCSAEFTWTHPRLIDNCKEGVATVKYVPNDPALSIPTGGVIDQGSEVTEVFAVGETIVRYILEDAVGNIDSCEFLITVLDVEDPIVVCPANIIINLDPGLCRIAVDYEPASATDNCAVVDTTMVPPSGSLFEIGTTEVTITITDPADNMDVCTFDVIVNEFVPSSFEVTCNNLINVALDSDCSAEITADMILEGSNYGCYEDYEITVSTQIGVIPNSPIIGQEYIGETLIVNVFDPETNNECWGEVFIEDNAQPVFDCPANLTVFCNESTLPATTGEPLLTSCEISTTNAYNDILTDFDDCSGILAEINRAWTVTDANGNNSECVQTITVEAIEFADITFPEYFDGVANPLFNCADVAANPTLVQPANTGLPSVNGLPPTNGTYCSVSVTHTDNIFPTCDGSYDLIRTWAAYDSCLPLVFNVNPLYYQQLIRVRDNVAPTVVCPEDMMVSTDGTVCSATIDLPVLEIEDACSSFSVSIDTPNGTIENNGGQIIGGVEIGVYTVTYNITDNCGNRSTCEIDLTVADQTPPIPACDEITNVALTSGGESVVFAETFNDNTTDNCFLSYLEVRRMTDNCGNADDLQFGPSVSFCCEDVPNNLIQIQLRAYDVYDNFNDCMIQVEVEDKIAPYVVDCPDNQTIDCEVYFNNYAEAVSLGSLSIFDSFGDAAFYDNCSVNLSSDVVIDIDNCGAGTIVRSFTANDDSDFTPSASCMQTITIETVSDWVVEFPADLTIECGDEVPDFGEPTIFFDNCELIAVSSEDATYDVVPDACYQIIRTWTAINWCLFNENGLNTVLEQPEVDLIAGGVNLDTDNDRDNRTYQDGLTVGNYPNANPDGYIRHIQTLRVIDDLAPVLTNPGLQEVCIDGTECFTTVVLPTPNATDCSEDISYTVSGDFGVGFAPIENVAAGVYQVQYTATDNCGNQSTVSFAVNVTDCKAPTPYCTAGLIVELSGVDADGDGTFENGNVATWASDFDAGSFDNCSDAVSLTISLEPNDFANATVGLNLDCSHIGNNEVYVYVQDEAGNVDVCETSVFVESVENICPNDFFIRGTIATEEDVPTENVYMTANSDESSTDITAVDGEYFLNTLEQGNDYTVTPERDDDHDNGVTTIDLVFIRQHILNTNPLDSPYKVIAADANNSQSITTADIVLLRQLILSVIDELPSNTSWRFVDANHEFANQTNPWWPQTFPEVVSINNLPESVENVDFVAVKIGDVNGSVTANLADNSSEERSNSVYFVEYEMRETESGVAVDFYATESILGFQFALKSPSFVKADFTDALLNQANSNQSTEKEAILFSWNVGAREMQVGEKLFSLNSTEAISPILSENILRTEAYDLNGNIQTVELRERRTASSDVTTFFSAKPNPFNQSTMITFSAPRTQEATLKIFSAAGQLAYEKTMTANKGTNELVISADELRGTGVYWLRLQSGDEVVSEKLILVE